MKRKPTTAKAKPHVIHISGPFFYAQFLRILHEKLGEKYKQHSDRIFNDMLTSKAVFARELNGAGPHVYEMTKAYTFTI